MNGDAGLKGEARVTVALLLNGLGHRFEVAQETDAILAASPDCVWQRQRLVLLERVGEEELEHAGLMMGRACWLMARSFLAKRI